MKKKLFIITTIIITIGILVFFYIQNKSTIISLNKKETIKKIENNKKIEKQIINEQVRKKIERIKKKNELKLQIKSSQMYLDNGENRIALSKYLKVLKEIPGDEKIINQI
jgi:hypothetical protein